MILRILRDSLFRQKRRKGIVLAATALGTMAAAALGDIALDVGDRMNRELKSFGANLVVLPRGGSVPVTIGGEDLAAVRVPAYLAAEDLARVKDNFWKNNILSFAPILDTDAVLGGRRLILRGTWFERAALPGDAAGETPGNTAGGADADARTGVRSLNPSWTVEGDWPEDGAATVAASVAATASAAGSAPPAGLVGRELAASLSVRPGADLRLSVAGRDITLHVAGILSAGGEEDGMILAPIEAVQQAAGLPGRVSRVMVSALTTPESAVYERLATNPRALPPAEFEKWSCTPFASSIAYEIERSVPGSEARVIRRVASAEGAILSRASWLMTLIAVMAATGAALTVTSALTTGVLERRTEIGLFKAMGASGAMVTGLFLAEATILGLIGGAAGALGGAALARFISTSVFGVPVAIRPMAIPLAIGMALGITLLGSLLPARRIAAVLPAEVLRGQ